MRCAGTKSQQGFLLTVAEAADAHHRQNIEQRLAQQVASIRPQPEDGVAEGGYRVSLLLAGEANQPGNQKPGALEVLEEFFGQAEDDGVEHVS